MSRERIPTDKIVMPKDDKDAARFLLQAINGSTYERDETDGEYLMNLTLVNRVIHYLEGKSIGTDGIADDDSPCEWPAHIPPEVVPA